MHLLSQALNQTQPQELQEAILQHGAVLIRSGASLKEFLNFSQDCANTWGPFVEQGERPGQQRTVGGNSGREVVQENPSLFTTTGQYEGHPVPLHGELYFQQKSPPQLLWFYCQKKPLSNGETLLCDGIQIFASLPPKLQTLLSTRSLVYIRQHDKNTWPKLYGSSNPQEVSTWLTSQGFTYTWTENQSLITQFKTPAIIKRAKQSVFINNLLPFAFRQTYNAQKTRARIYLEGDEEPLSKALFTELEAITKTLTDAIKWEAGDIALVDNTRVLHGRNTVTDTQRQIYVRMSKANFLAAQLTG